WCDPGNLCQIERRACRATTEPAAPSRQHLTSPCLLVFDLGYRQRSSRFASRLETDRKEGGHPRRIRKLEYGRSPAVFRRRGWPPLPICTLTGDRPTVAKLFRRTCFSGGHQFERWCEVSQARSGAIARLPREERDAFHAVLLRRSSGVFG